ncbi:MAG: hypothetical protein ACTH3E_08915 [Psychroflexus halocasei]|uniref:hypothetical protein n=1 Tax=Psychroflexus sp. S27 TaxID=1982757 RepID=UPI000C29C497|nr:hypothetical protein [Psychroflexus sp. S27]PJX21554.1 hypothetical protein CAP47_07875 [Psychroflexus sp. S27]
MKSKGILLLIFTTLLLITLSIFSSMNIAISWIFYLTMFGQLILISAVYHTLREDYHTNKTFKDWYEDRPELSK